MKSNSLNKLVTVAALTSAVNVANCDRDTVDDVKSTAQGKETTLSIPPITKQRIVLGDTLYPAARFVSSIRTERRRGKDVCVVTMLDRNCVKTVLTLRGGTCESMGAPKSCKNAVANLEDCDGAAKGEDPEVAEAYNCAVEPDYKTFKIGMSVIKRVGKIKSDEK